MRRWLLWPAVVEAALHLPVPQVELPLGAAVQARTVGAAVAGEGTAHVNMPATEDTRHQAVEFARQGRRVHHRTRQGRIAHNKGRTAHNTRVGYR